MSQQFSIPPTIQEIHTVIKNRHGQEILTIGMEEYAVKDPDGTISVRKVSQNIELVDGTIWNPSMMLGDKRILIGVCSLCREASMNPLHPRTPSHGLVAIKHAKVCAGCGQLLCPSHQVVCADHRRRCPRCARKHSIKHFFHRLFFKLEEI